MKIYVERNVILYKMKDILLKISKASLMTHFITGKLPYDNFFHPDLCKIPRSRLRYAELFNQ